MEIFRGGKCKIQGFEFVTMEGVFEHTKVQLGFLGKMLKSSGRSSCDNFIQFAYMVCGVRV